MAAKLTRNAKWFLIIFGLFHLLILVLVLMPRKYTRQVRHFLAHILMTIWHLSSRVLGMGHDVMWQRGNGS